MNTTDTNTPQGRHIDHTAVEREADDLETFIRNERANAYGPAWRQRFASRDHLHNSIAS